MATIKLLIYMNKDGTNIDGKMEHTWIVVERLAKQGFSISGLHHAFKKFHGIFCTS